MGKTFIIEDVCKKHCKSFVKLNFIENKKAVTLFENADDTDTLLLRLSAVIEDPLIPYETVVFLDEVQECKEIVTAIKFWWKKEVFDTF